MASNSGTPLETDTRDWLRRAGRLVRRGSAPGPEASELARQGMRLRRQWDRRDRHAPLRRELLALLPDVQTTAQKAWCAAVHESGQAKDAFRGLIEGEIEEDERYLIELLERRHESPELSAFAIECFRDDLHWLGTQVAVLDGQTGIDFPGRVLLEQDALVRDLEAWEDEIRAFERRGAGSGRGGGLRPEGGAPDEGHRPARKRRNGSDRVAEPLRRAARRLRATAVARQIQTLRDQPEPADWQGWYQRWQAASQLAMRVDPELIRNEPGDSAEGPPLGEADVAALESLRAEARDRWLQALGGSDFEARTAALEQTAEELSDGANESLTFVQDSSLEDAVHDLEILHEDLTTGLGAVRSVGQKRTRLAARRLRRCRYRVASELQERRLAWRLERRFGRGFVVAMERLILFLLVLFCVMLVAEGPLLRYEARQLGVSQLQVEQSLVEPVLAWIDLGICLVFLAEFWLKWSLATPKGLYFWRHWFTGLLPAIPVGFVAHATDYLQLSEKGDLLVLVRFLRYLRLPEMARWLRIARPALRLTRLLAFTIRASDRIVRQLAPLLNRNLLLFERGAVRVHEPRYRMRLAGLRERFSHRARERLEELPLAERVRLVQTRMHDLAAMLSAPHLELAPAAFPAPTSASREIPLERVIARLLAATPAGISDRIGRQLASSVARWCQALDVFAVRRLPIVRDLVAAGGLPSPYETTAQVANRIGLALNQLLDRIYWLADLYGTVTAPQLVDSLGEYLVKGTARPARRLVLIGAALLVITYLASWIPAPTLNHLAQVLQRLFGWPLVLLGGICMVFFALGLWLRQIAGEASEFYNQVADAQFITVTRNLKLRLAPRYHPLLEQRVWEPEAAVAGPDGSIDPLRQVVRLIWRDYLDGAPFHPSDTRTTNQLLGNLALVSLRDTRLGLSRRDRKRLRRLDLVNQRMSLKGPYLWFHFISRSLSQQTAKLAIDYNAFALPLGRASTAQDWEILRYVRWLARRLRCPVDQLELPEPFRTRFQALPATATETPPAAPQGRFFQGNDFTAVHFLTADPEVEADIRQRYGDQVADLMRRDRRDNIRRVFRTYPFHHWPKERRVLNPLALYQRHLAGGRVLLLPIKLALWTAVMLWRAGRAFARTVRDVLEPRVGDVAAALEDYDPYAVAVRKIHRMRKPLFLECLRMRALVDPEYLGVTPPGGAGSAIRSAVPAIESDLETLGAPPTLRAEFRQLANQRRAQRAALLRLLGPGIDLPPAAWRAMFIAYAIDYQQIRTRFEATETLRQAFPRELATRRRFPAGWGFSLRGLWCRWRLRGKTDRLFQQPAFRRFAAANQAACRRLVWRGPRTLAAAVRTLAEAPSPTGDPVADAREALLAVGRDPETWTRQLVILRAVQTLSVIDLKTYCDIVAELGEYDVAREESPEPPAGGREAPLPEAAGPAPPDHRQTTP